MVYNLLYMLYTKKNSPLEKYIGNSENLHLIEDFLRDKLLSGKDNILSYEIIILARILWGRILNSTVEGGGKLDARHSKAQMLTLICMSFYLTRCPSLFNTENFRNLHKLLSYHLKKIFDFISQSEMNDENNFDNYQYYIFCKRWIFFCDALLKNRANSQTDIAQKHQIIALTIKGQVKSKFKLEVNQKMTNYIKTLKIDHFIHI